MDAMGFWNKTDHNLTEEDVDRISEGMVLSTAVDRGQMPLNSDIVPDSPERSLVRAILFDAVECSTRHIDSRICSPPRPRTDSRRASGSSCSFRGSLRSSDASRYPTNPGWSGEYRSARSAGR